MEGFQSLIDEAVHVLAPIVRQTPVEHSPVLSDRLGVPVHLKLECLQLTGSFKIRGAYFALHTLRKSGVDRVATCSAGNHGVGVAFAARRLGLEALIYVPASVDESKAALLSALGAEVIRSPYQGFDETEVWALDQTNFTGVPFVSAYDDPLILAGNGGTLMREVRHQLPALQTVIVPVGGGGLSGGMVAADERPARLIAAQPAASSALSLSLERGEAVTRLPAVDTMAGGLEGGIGTTGFEALKDHVGQVIQVSEPAIAEGVRWVLTHHRYLIEPSSAVAVAAALDPDVRPQGETVLVLSGRNVALDTLRGLL